MKTMITLALLALAAPAFAVPTPVAVRVLSQGAKFIGDGMGGVEVTLTDVATGKMLKQGKVIGGTGDTTRIMNGAPRGERLATEGVATFATMLDIAEPTEIRLTVNGPLKPAGTAVSLTTTRWLIPGQPIAGDGWVVELPGLALTAKREGGKVVADVSMLCGCPIAPGSLWDAKRFRIDAWVGDKRVPLTYAGQTGRFAGEVPAGATWVTALDALSGASSAVRLAP
jgi:hypothetical protein